MYNFSFTLPAKLVRSLRFTVLTLLGTTGALMFALAGASTATAATTVVVNVGGADDVFTPATVDINVGDTVMWVWQSDGHS
ncbi:MAG: hypothetical protein H0W66_01655, partial [Chthoniobacterales bacterium]|nr:hypothetical protein [Chthoniobacterales bacterium]